MTDFPQYWWAEPGRKVVCLKTWNGGSGKGYGDEIGPVAGESYTIRSVLLHPAYATVCVLLAEVSNPARVYRFGGFYEPPFRLNLFRPLFPEKRDTDIAQFTHLLNTAPSRTGVDA